MNIIKKMVLSVGAITLVGSLTGCTAFNSFSEVEALNNAQAVGSPFTQSLAEEYRVFANVELKDMFDYPDALHFARKGLAAASGEAVLPEPISDWNLSEEHAAELSTARGRLLATYDLGAREIAPPLAATVQAKFDCWIEQQEEDWQSEDIDACKTEFLDSIALLEAEIQPPPPPAEPVAEVDVDPFDVDASQPMAVENAMYLVFFNWDSSKLGSGALNVLDAVAQEIVQNPPESLNVVGHTDTSGPAQYNEKLAKKRASTVRDALIERGVPAEKIIIDAKGENELLVETPDNVREPANRRVNISFN